MLGASVGIGVTHYSPSSFAELEEALSTARFQNGPGTGEPARARVRAAAAAARGGARREVIVMRPLGQGALARRAPSAEELEPLAPFGVRTWAQALLKWALSDPPVDVVNPGDARPGSRTRERGGRRAAVARTG
jgi:hypothetical protein